MKNQLSPPGRLINVNGRKVHVQCFGSGSPSVVFESGLFDTSFAFAKVQPQLSTFTKTISYDRAGVGYSESSSNPNRVSAVMASELYELLETLKLHKPVVLVGWSAGGIYIREFAHEHPEMIAGMVFIDSAHESGFDRYPGEIARILQKGWDELIELFNRMSKLTHEELLIEIADSNPWQDWHPDTHKYLEDTCRPEFLKYCLQLGSYFDEDTNLGDDALKSLGDIPLVVISRVKSNNPNLNVKQARRASEIFNVNQSELAGLSTVSRHIKVDCGHDIANEKPEIVIKAIEDVVKQVR